MVFENVTLVELHVENSPFDAESSPLEALGRFRRSGSESETEEAEHGESRSEEEGGRSLRGPMMVLLLLVAGAAVAARRRRKSTEEPAAGEQISIEQAAEQ